MYGQWFLLIFLECLVVFKTHVSGVVQICGYKCQGKILAVFVLRLLFCRSKSHNLALLYIYNMRCNYWGVFLCHLSLVVLSVWQHNYKSFNKFLPVSPVALNLLVHKLLITENCLPHIQGAGNTVFSTTWGFSKRNYD